MAAYPGGFYNPPKMGYGDGAPLPLLNNLTADQAALMAKYDPKQIIDGSIYDTKYAVAGTAVNQNDIIFFSQQLAQQDALINNSAVTFTKTRMDTNMTMSGQLERGTTMLVTSLQAQVTIPNNLDSTLQGSGNTTLPLVTGTAVGATTTTAGVLAGGLWKAITSAGYLEFIVGPNRFENGTIDQFPCEFGASGFNAAVESGTIVATNIPVIDGVVNNGFGFARQFFFPRTILPGQNFQVKLNFYNLFNPSRNFNIKVLLRGLIMRDIA